jgi:CheY-like chemotaxis protein
MPLNSESISDLPQKIVLCVDDAPENLSALNMVLLSNGYAFVGAASGDDCLKLVAKMKPKLVLLDIQMPGIDGFETCRRLRRLPQTAKVPIAFLTARRAGEDVKAGIAAGGNDFIIKPFDREKLMARVRHWVDGPAKPVEAQEPAQTTMTWNLSSDRP